MKKITTNSVIGIAVTLGGLWWVFWALLRPFYNSLCEENSIFEYVFLFVFLSLIALPGILLAYFGFRLTKNSSGANIKGVVGSLSIFGVIWMYAFILDVFGTSKVTDGLYLLISTLVMVLVYIAVSRYWMKTSGLSPIRGEFIGKGIVTIIALQIWGAGSDIAREFSPVIKEGFTPMQEVAWRLIGFIGSILVAWIFFKGSMRLIEKKVDPEFPTTL